MRKTILFSFILFLIANNTIAQEYAHSVTTGKYYHVLEGRQFCIDSKGNLYTISTTDENLRTIDLNNQPIPIKMWSKDEDYYENAIISKFTSKGELVWTRGITFYSNNDKFDYRDFTIRADKNNVYVIGSQLTTADSDSISITLQIDKSNDTTLYYQDSGSGNNLTISSLICLNDDGYMVWAKFMEINNVAFTDNEILVTGYGFHKDISRLSKDGDSIGEHRRHGWGRIPRGSIKTFKNSNSYVVFSMQDQKMKIPLLVKFNDKHEMVDSFHFDWNLKDKWDRPQVVIGSGSVFTDQENNVYVIGNNPYNNFEFDGNTYTYDKGILIKLDSNLDLLWSKPFYGLDSSNKFSGLNMQIGQLGDELYIYSYTRVYNDTFKLYIDDKQVGLSSRTHLTVLTMDGEFIIDYTKSGVYALSQNDYDNRNLYVSTAGLRLLEMPYKKEYFSYGVVSKIKTNYSTISGVLYVDENQNNQYDIGEPLGKNMLINFNGKYYSSSHDGSYNLPAEIGENTIGLMPVKYFNTDSSTKTIYVNSYDTGINYNIPLKQDKSVNDLDIFITHLTPKTQLGKETTYLVTVRNKGTLTSNPTIRLNYDKRLDYILSTETIKDHVKTRLTWEIGELKPLETKNIKITFMIKTPPVAYNLDTLYSFVEAIPVVGAPISENDITETDNKDSIYTIISDDYIPNDKTVNRPWIIDVKIAQESIPIDYTIYFQNTGNDTVFHVFLIDSIESELVTETIEVLSSSHNYNMSIIKPNVVRCDFDNMILYDSITRMPESYGFIKFRIWTRDSLKVGDRIYNFADIYFDYKSPVRTSTTDNRIQRVSVVSTNNIETSRQVTIYPNPTSGNINVTIDLEAGVKADVKVTDLTGKQVYAETTTTDADGLNQTINLADLPQGIYFVQVYANNQVYTAKVVKQ